MVLHILFSAGKTGRQIRIRKCRIIQFRLKNTVCDRMFFFQVHKYSQRLRKSTHHCTEKILILLFRRIVSLFVILQARMGNAQHLISPRIISKMGFRRRISGCLAVGARRLLIGRSRRRFLFTVVTTEHVQFFLSVSCCFLYLCVNHINSLQWCQRQMKFLFLFISDCRCRYILYLNRYAQNIQINIPSNKNTSKLIKINKRI